MTTRTFRLALVAAALAGLAGAPAAAADYFVRTGGSDTACDGRADADQTSGASCAFRTIEKCNAVAECGDTCHIGPGFFAENDFEIRGACTPASPKTFRGSGRDVTFWMASMVDVDDATCTSEGQPAGVYRCARPPGVVPGHLAQSVLQRETTGVFGQDTSGRTVKWEMTGPVALTWNTVGPASVAGEEGHVYADANFLYIHPWDDRDPNTDGTDFWAPRDCRGSDSSKVNAQYGLVVVGSNVVIENLNIETGCGHGIQVGGLSGTTDGFTLRDVEIHGGRLVFTANTTNARIQRFEVTNGYRRDNDASGVAQAWGFPSTSMVSVKGSGHLFEDGYITAGRNCWGFTAATHDHTVRRVRADSCYNHNITISDRSEKIRIQDSVFFSSQDFQISCGRHIWIENSTIYTQLVVQDASCSDKTFPVDVDVHNSWVCSFQFHGQTWENGGHDFDHNLYPIDHVRCFHGSSDQFKAATGRFTTLGGWKNWSQDPCANCTRDPNSLEESIDATFVQPATRHDDAAPRDLHLKAGSKAIDLGVAGFGSGRDAAGIARVGRPDAGAYEHEQGGGASNDPPGSADGLHRTDVK